MIGNLSFAAASHAFPATLRNPQQNADGEQTSSSALGGYRFIVLAMWAGLIIGGFCIWRHVPYAVIVTEYVEIGLFVAYWLVATRRDWKNRSERALEQEGLAGPGRASGRVRAPASLTGRLNA
jgi:hypothetical protein